MEDFKIKIGREELVVHPGEYFLDNGSILQFEAKGDSSRMKKVRGFRGFGGYCNLIVPKKREDLIRKNPRFTRIPSKVFPGCFLYILNK